MKILIAVVIFIVGFGVGYLTGTSGGTITSQFDAAVEETRSGDEGTETPAEESAASTSTEITAEGDVTVEADALSNEQQALLRSFGIDPNGITLTAEMIACAKESVGEARLEVILGGASPTFFESASLLGCYQN